MSGKRKYVYRWWDGPTYRQESFDTKREKDEFMAEVRRRRRLGLPLSFAPDERMPTVAEYVEHYWATHAVPRLEESTRRTYEHHWLKWLLPRVGGCQLDQVDVEVIHRELLAHMRERGAGEPTIRYALAVLQSIFALAVSEGKLTLNPVALVRKPRADVEREVQPITPDLIEIMRARVPAREAAMLSFLGYQALRPEELLALRVEDLGDGGIDVRRKVVDGQVRRYTKTRTNRVVPWTAPVVRRDIVAYMLAAGVRRGLLFPRADGAPWRKHDWDNWRERVYQPLARAVGLPGARVELPDGAPADVVAANELLPQPVPYDLRGSAVSLWAWEGVPMKEVAERAGHSVATCDRHYARVFRDAAMAERVTAEAAITRARARVGQRAGEATG